MYRNSWLNNQYSDLTILHWTEDYTRKFYEPIEAAGRQADGQTIWFPENQQAITAGSSMNIYGSISAETRR